MIKHQCPSLYTCNCTIVGTVVGIYIVGTWRYSVQYLTSVYDCTFPVKNSLETKRGMAQV